MVSGNPHIKMSTSVIDYIFRELAITYLDRADLAHVAPEDLRGDALHRDEDDVPEFETEEVVEERVYEPKASTHPLTPRTGHMHPLEPHTNGNGTNGHTNGNGHHGSAPHSPAFRNGNSVAAAAPMSTTAEKVRLALLKGYEGDPCSECGQLTLVRSGSCCKCDTCGATSGCS
jgi:ribonucleoside-diphosphate reductase alpha chain